MLVALGAAIALLYWLIAHLLGPAMQIWAWVSGLTRPGLIMLGIALGLLGGGGSIGWWSQKRARKPIVAIIGYGLAIFGAILTMIVVLGPGAPAPVVPSAEKPAREMTWQDVCDGPMRVSNNGQVLFCVIREDRSDDVRVGIVHPLGSAMTPGQCRSGAHRSSLAATGQAVLICKR